MDVSFSDRLHNIMALQGLLSIHGSDAQLEAKKLEERAYQQAKSKVSTHYPSPRGEHMLT